MHLWNACLSDVPLEHGPVAHRDENSLLATHSHIESVRSPKVAISTTGLDLETVALRTLGFRRRNLDLSLVRTDGREQYDIKLFALKRIDSADTKSLAAARELGKGFTGAPGTIHQLHHRLLATAQGFANGITSTEDGVNRSMDDMTSSALDIATNAAQMLYDVATGQETAEPIFTPVLNLSDYASPTSWAATQAYTPSAETAERVYRSNELAQRIGGNQNGVLTKSQSGNSDVVNAISQLGNRVDRMAESISKMKLVLDSGKTVGELAPKIDSNMGGRNILAERGVI